MRRLVDRWCRREDGVGDFLLRSHSILVGVHSAYVRPALGALRKTRFCCFSYVLRTPATVSKAPISAAFYTKIAGFDLCGNQPQYTKKMQEKYQESPNLSSRGSFS
jgi:hypothetical protein